ncbi:MAG: Rnf-Nqr domain containing protein [Oscillospiraceae bacterium]
MTTNQNNKTIDAARSNKSIFDGLYEKNTVLASGLVIAPVVVAANSLKAACVLCLFFSILTFFTILISSFVPRDIVYAIRIILYTFIASLVYVPVMIFLKSFFPTEIASLGIFIPLLITNSLIVSQTEINFFKKSKGRMIAEVFFYILGFDVVVLIFAFVREVFAYGSIGDRILGIPLTFPALALPFGGFILLGLFAALFRLIKTTARRK